MTALTPTTAAQTAVVFHTHLEAAALNVLTATLRTAGYEPSVLTDVDLGDIQQTGAGLLDGLKGHDLLVLDERIGERPALEYILFLKGHPETSPIPMAVLHTDPYSFLTASAYFVAGVDSLVVKRDAAAMVTAFQKAEIGVWERCTADARRAVFFAQEAAASAGDDYVSTEHLLLGLIRNQSCAAATILVSDLHLSLGPISEALYQQMKPVTEPSDVQRLTLTPRVNDALTFALQETQSLGRKDIGTDSLLLGLIREGGGLAARTLAALGVDLKRVRTAVQERQQAGR